MRGGAQLEEAQGAGTRSVAGDLRRVLGLVLGEPLPVAVRAWDGSHAGPPDAPTVRVSSPVALRRLVAAPSELGVARAYVAGELDVEGDLERVLALREGVERRHALRGSTLAAALRLARQPRVLGRPPTALATEARLHGLRHTRRRDAAAVAYHYDVSNAFYALLLGPSLTYSCAVWPTAATTLEQAQAAKHELVLRKLGIPAGGRLLDVGCGWGSLALHAAAAGLHVVGVTLSREQCRLARERVAAAGLDDRVEIRLQDYRDVDDGPFDGIASVGMVEHVGRERLDPYAERLFALLRGGGRLLNHGISRPPGPRSPRAGAFVQRFIFPDGELHEIGSVVRLLERHGFEVRDVESLREHYTRTLRAWSGNLDAGWSAAVREAGLQRARAWRLYLAGSAAGFAHGRISVHQVLAVRPGPRGASGMPRTRRDWVVGPPPVERR